jgi:hypothetical protein
MMAAIRERITGSVIGLSTPLVCAHSLPSGVVNHSDHGCSGEPQRMLFRDLFTEFTYGPRAALSCRQSNAVVECLPRDFE